MKGLKIWEVTLKQPNSYFDKLSSIVLIAANHKEAGDKAMISYKGVARFVSEVKLIAITDL